MIHVGSNSEIDAFRQCPKKHEWSYKGCWLPPEVSPALAKGSLWHLVQEEHWKYLWVCQQEKTKPDAQTLHKLIIPILYNERGNYRGEHSELIEWMYEGYLQKWGIDTEWKILGVEHAFEFWLPTPRGTRSNYKIRMKLDLIVQTYKDNHIWLVDHKSGKDLPTDKMLELDTQFGLYTWGLRKAGKKVFGQIHDAARTQRNKSPMLLDDRFRRTMMYRTDEQLDKLAVDAYRSMRRAWGVQEGDAERAFNPDTCRWRCDFTEPCLLCTKRKDPDEAEILKGFGFSKGDPYARYR